MTDDYADKPITAEQALALTAEIDRLEEKNRELRGVEKKVTPEELRRAHGEMMLRGLTGDGGQRRI